MYVRKFRPLPGRSRTFVVYCPGFRSISRMTCSFPFSRPGLKPISRMASRLYYSCTLKSPFYCTAVWVLYHLALILAALYTISAILLYSYPPIYAFFL